MNIPHIKLNAIIATLFIFSAQAYADLNDEICKNTKYLNCLNSTVTKCMAANSQSETICLKIFPISTEEEPEREYDTARKYGKCATSEYIKALNVSPTKFESCTTHLEPLLDKHRKNIEAKLKASKERFHDQ